MTRLRGLVSRTADRSSERSWVTRRCGGSRPTPTARPTPTCTSSRCPRSWGVDLYLKDESVHPTGSLKHRLARSLFLYGSASGWIAAARPSWRPARGSTAVSEAYFARLIGVPFVAVMPRSTSPEKIALIERQGGRCHFVEDAALDVRRGRSGSRPRCGGHYMDQFTYAERATDWRGNNNIAESIFAQLAHEPHPVPEWIVVGAGTGGTSRHDRPLPALPPLPHPAGRRRPGELGVLRPAGPPARPTTPPACRRGSRASAAPRMEPSFVPGRDRPDDRRAGRGQRRRRPAPARRHRPLGGRLDRHQPVGRLAAGRRACAAAASAAASSR